MSEHIRNETMSVTKRLPVVMAYGLCYKSHQNYKIHFFLSTEILVTCTWRRWSGSSPTRPETSNFRIFTGNFFRPRRKTIPGKRPASVSNLTGEHNFQSS